jgi:hypothetical protein
MDKKSVTEAHQSMDKLLFVLPGLDDSFLPHDGIHIVIFSNCEYFCVSVELAVARQPTIKQQSFILVPQSSLGRRHIGKHGFIGINIPQFHTR